MVTESVLTFWAMFVSIFATATALPALYKGVRNRLPLARLRALLAALQELDGLYYYSLESGFMSDLSATALRGQVHALHIRTDALHFRAMEATTFRAKLKNWSDGLSGEISETIRDVHALRGKIAAMSRGILEAQQQRPACVHYCHDIKAGIPTYHDTPSVAMAGRIDPVGLATETKASVAA